jgi:hypothetical protein
MSFGHYDLPLGVGPGKKVSAGAKQIDLHRGGFVHYVSKLSQQERFFEDKASGEKFQISAE